MQATEHRQHQHAPVAPRELLGQGGRASLHVSAPDSLLRPFALGPRLSPIVAFVSAVTAFPRDDADHRPHRSRDRPGGGETSDAVARWWLYRLDPRSGLVFAP